MFAFIARLVCYGEGFFLCVGRIYGLEVSLQSLRNGGQADVKLIKK